MCSRARAAPCVRFLSGTRPPAPRAAGLLRRVRLPARRTFALIPLHLFIDQRNELLNAADNIMLQVRLVACVLCSAALSACTRART